MISRRIIVNVVTFVVLSVILFGITLAVLAVQYLFGRAVVARQVWTSTGLAAWLWHRREMWCDGDAISVFGRDFLCTLASLYWFNTSFASSIRLYAEQFGHPPVLVHDRERIIEAPTGFGIFPKELLFVPRSVAERHTDLRAWNIHDRGGHFAPAERPGNVVADLRAFFRPLR